MCDIAGIKIPEGLDGVSLKNIWLGESEGNPDRTMFWVRREGGRKYGGQAYYAVRRGAWKLQQSSPFEPMVLVNLDQDPLEKRPAPDTGKIAKELLAALMSHIQEAGQVPWQEEQ